MGAACQLCQQDQGARDFLWAGSNSSPGSQETVAGASERLPAQLHAEAGELGAGGEVHVGGVVVGEVVIAVGDVVVVLGCPGGVVAGVERTESMEKADTGAGERKVVGAIVVAGLGVVVADDGQVEALARAWTVG